MTHKDTSAPAFPSIEKYHKDTEEICTQWHPGLTKREYFAGLAMQAILSNPAVPDAFMPGERANYIIARAAFAYADTMIEEGGK